MLSAEDLLLAGQSHKADLGLGSSNISGLWGVWDLLLRAPIRDWTIS